MAIHNNSEIFIDLTCPKCNAQMEIDSSGKRANCAYCGNSMLIKATHEEISNEEATRIIKERIEESNARQRERIKEQKIINENNKKKAELEELNMKAIIWLYAFLSLGCSIITTFSRTVGIFSCVICILLTIYIAIKGVKDIGVRIALFVMIFLLIAMEGFALFIS